MHVPLWGWLAFLAALAVMFAVDLVLVGRRSAPVSLRVAVWWALSWAGVGLAFTGVVALTGGTTAAAEYVSGYVLERSLAVDNLFVFAVILSFFAVPAVARQRALGAGIIGALGLRAVFIAAGLAAVGAFSWTLYLLGALLVATGLRMARHQTTEVHPDRNPAVRLLHRVVPLSPAYDGGRFLTRVGGRRMATPLVAVLVAIATADVVFAVDSIPAVFAITREPFLVFAVNAMSLLGLRATYVVLADMLSRFRHLQTGLAVVLVVIGAKMLATDLLDVPVWATLLTVITILGVSVAASLRTRSEEFVTGQDAAAARAPSRRRSPAPTARGE